MANISGPGSGPAPAKFCPRCGAFYSDVRSRTCPQCFAPLEALSDEAAETLTAEQDARSRDPEALALKLADDDKFKQQAFGGCLGIAAVVLVTLVLAIVIVVGAHRRSAPSPIHNARTASSASVVRLPASLAGSPRSAEPFLPNGNREWLPSMTASPYQNGIVLYGAPSSLSTDDLRTFREYADYWEDQQTGIHSRKEIIGHGVDYIIYAPTDSLAGRAAADLTGATVPTTPTPASGHPSL